MNGSILPLWKGGRVYLVGGGPSLRDFDATLLKGKRVIVINNAYKLIPNAEVLFFMDAVWYNWHREDLKQFKGLIYTTASSLVNNPRVMFLKPGTRRGIDDRPGYISKGTSSGYGAIGVAVAFGVKEIILLGYDLQVDSEGNHNYHNEHKRTVPDTIYKDTHMVPFKSLPKAAEERGIRIINCSLTSALDCFPKEALEKWL